jgi:GntR family transcriptional regulator/MocR family aminotransferase
LLAAGASLVPVPVDGEGFDVSAGIASCPTARLAYVTPSYQYPLGMTMSLPRRMALLEWASRTGAWIIEDDYGSEHRYHGRPLASLQGLDRDGRVIYLGSFSRVLFPAIGLCYAVLPPGLVDACIAARAAVEGPQRLFEQSVVADFIAEGHFARHLRRMRNLYAERQEVLLRVAARELDGLLELRPAEGGTFLVGRLPHGVNDLEASRVALQQGIVADPLSPLYVNRPRQGGLLLGYTSVSAARIGEGVCKLAAALNAVYRPRKRSARIGKVLR